MKHLRTILLFLLLGAVVNVGVAWTCAHLKHGKLTWIEIRDSDISIWHVQMREGWTAEPSKRGKSTSFGYIYDVMWGGMSFPVDASANSGTDKPVSWLGGHFKEWRIGWPMQCLRRRTWLASGKNIPNNHVFATGMVEEGLVILPENSLFKMRAQRFPIDPIWAGLIYNTVYFAASFWLLASGLVWGWRYYRLKRGLCPRCAYDLSGTDHATCPECGAPINKPNPA